MIQQLVMYEEELAQINNICEVLHRDANARAVLVIDKNGQAFAQAGEVEQLDITSLSSLTAGNVAYGRSSGGIQGAVQLGADASDVTVAISDANGNLLKTMSLGAQSKGTVSFDWDGTTDAGIAAGSGPFTVNTYAADNGATVSSQALVWAPVAAVSMPSGGEAQLTLPGIGQVPVSDVVEVG